jgi:hypothetical protein
MVLSLWGFVLDIAVCVCVCVCVWVAGVVMHAEWAGLLLPGGREGKIHSCESVCVLVGMIGEAKN